MTLYSNFTARGHRNALVNGNFISWPAGTSFTASGYTAAMTIHGFSTSGSFTASASSASKPNDNCNNVHMVTTTAAETGPTTSEHSHTLIRIEGYDFLPFVGKTATLSFWVRSTVTGTYSISFKNIAPSDRSYVVPYTINQSNTWEYKTITLKFDYSGGNWSYSNGMGLQISFTQMAGPTYITSSVNQWVTGNYLAATGQVNNAATIGNTFQLSQCQLELGSVATEYEHIDLSISTRIWQRYYSYIYNSHKYGTSVGTGTGTCYISMKYPSPMRAAPTITISGGQIWLGAWRNATSTANAGAWLDGCVSLLYDTSYGGYSGVGSVLIAGTWYFDARL